MSIELDSRKGLAQIRRIYEDYPKQSERAAVLAVNEAARFGRAEGLREMKKQVNLGVQYMGDRLVIDQRAREGDIVATIVGRYRPTSLARFITGVFKRGKPVKVKVKADGGTKLIPGAFPVRLRAGKELGNEGLAVRLRHGQAPKNFKGIKLREDKSGVTYLLYGPSVDQIFRTVRDDITPAIGERLSNEFTRQFARLTANG